MNQEQIIGKIKSLQLKKGSFSERACKLISSSEWDKPLTSRKFTYIYNEGPGKSIIPAQLTALMQPLLKEEIVKIKVMKEGKKKIKLWLPGWISKEQIEEKFNCNLLNEMHPEIRRVSEKVFKDNHYAEAIFNAFKRVNNLVKEKSGKRDLDGKDLMLTVFSRNNPILKFNNLVSRTDQDEQEGFMHLFAGAIMGIRNPKAHEDIVQLDKIKTLEYLSFASLLCRRLDDTSKV